jgi:hypothetical protein
MHIGFEKLDPRWQMISASLRKGQLYVKMPIAKARALLIVWHVVSQKAAGPADHSKRINALIKLIEDEAVGSQTYGIASVFYMASDAECQEDIDALTSFVAEDATGVLQSFKDALEKGMQSDPEVDWIARVGGPQAHPFEALQMEPEPVDQLSFDDLFGDPAV